MTYRINHLIPDERFVSEACAYCEHCYVNTIATLVTGSTTISVNDISLLSNSTRLLGLMGAAYPEV